MSKRVTKEIERNNMPNRHWFARCKRKSIVVSKSLEMVDVTMALYAKFHVSGDDTILLKSLQI
jgi:IS1 family transposase